SAISIYVISCEIKGALVNLNGEILESQSFPVPKEADNPIIIDRIKKILKFLVNKLPEKSQLIGIGTSLPGTVNGEKGRWISSARWPELSNISLTELISEFNVPLSLNRSLDPELEFLLFNNEKYRQGGTLLFHWGYGIGSAFASRGKILKSGIGRFGEVGHWQVIQDSGKQCSCGSIGCLETEAALWAILPEIKEYYPDAPGDEPEFTDFIRNNDIGNLEVIKRALGYVTVSLANLYKVFYPDRILLLGPFVEDSSIYNELKNGLLALIPEYARHSVNLDVVYGFQGAVSGSIYHLFRDALRPLLRTRTNV
ncbi:MAG: ROK family protein, partial [Candidatus Heimdallarchaeota archaeon]|nr:ROK family protein [Candidatus Heimdallarchaeota archaeon]